MNSSPSSRNRLRGLLIEIVKIFRGFSGLDPAFLFELSVNRTRNHEYKLVPPRLNTVLYSNFPTVRVYNLWNSLPEAVENVPSVHAFEKRLDMIFPFLFLLDPLLSPFFLYESGHRLSVPQERDMELVLLTLRPLRWGCWRALVLTK